MGGNGCKESACQDEPESPGFARMDWNITPHMNGTWLSALAGSKGRFVERSVVPFSWFFAGQQGRIKEGFSVAPRDSLGEKPSLIRPLESRSSERLCGEGKFGSDPTTKLPGLARTGADRGPGRAELFTKRISWSD